MPPPPQKNSNTYHIIICRLWILWVWFIYYHDRLQTTENSWTGLSNVLVFNNRKTCWHTCLSFPLTLNIQCYKSFLRSWRIWAACMVLKICLGISWKSCCANCLWGGYICDAFIVVAGYYSNYCRTRLTLLTQGTSHIKRFLNTERSYKRQGHATLKHFVGFLCNGGKPK